MSASNVSSNSYNKVNGGKLKLKVQLGITSKGITTLPTGIIGIKRAREEDLAVHSSSSLSSSTSSNPVPNTIISTIPPPITTGPSKQKGSGKIIISGTTIHGKDTLFQSQITSGDAIEIEYIHDNAHDSEISSSSVLSSTTSTIKDTLSTTGTELRIVKFILSDKSLSISQPFTCPINPNGMEYYILKLPKVIKDSTTLTLESEKEKQLEQSKAIGLVSTTYHDKKYQHVQVPPIGNTTINSSSASREDLLLLRSKKKSDKFC